MKQCFNAIHFTLTKGVEIQLKKKMDLLNIDKEQLSESGRSVCKSIANIACALEVQGPTFSK
jgi:hypothetical protein